MDAAVAALLGAALGVIGSVGGTWLTQRHQTRRDLLRSAVELGVAERAEAVAATKLAGGGPVLPISVFVFHNAAVLQAIAENRYTPDVIRKLDEEQIELVKALPRRGKARETE